MFFLVVGPLRGGGVNPGPLREKPLFFEHYKKVPMTTKPRGGGKGLSGPTTKKNTFFAASLTKNDFFYAFS